MIQEGLVVGGAGSHCETPHSYERNRDYDKPIVLFIRKSGYYMQFTKNFEVKSTFWPCWFKVNGRLTSFIICEGK